MKIIVTGASGLLGSSVIEGLGGQGHTLWGLQRGAGASPGWDPETGRVNFGPATEMDAVVHLAGENIGARWTGERRRRIRESRVEGTRLLSGALAKLKRPPRVLCSASATGIYGNRGSEWLEETSAPGEGFLAELCRDWEMATEPARLAGIRVVNLRFGIVLSGRGGALRRMLPAFRCGLGARLGDGRQYWSWVSLADAVGAVQHALENAGVEGPVNVTAPEPATNGEFSAKLGRALSRPVFLAVPRIAVNVLFGEMGREALLASARVRPVRLLASGFKFRWPELESTLRAVLGT